MTIKLLVLWMVIRYGFSNSTECPDLCECSNDPQIHIDGLVANCSFIRTYQLSEALNSVSSDINTMYLDGIELAKYEEEWPVFYKLNQLYIRRAGILNVSLVLNNLKNKTSSSFHFLDLSSNVIEYLDITSFQYCPHLETLILKDNNIQHLSSNSFQHLSRLSYLYLSRNKINFVEVNTFSAMSNLIILDLSFNQLNWTQNVNNIFNGLHSLIELKLQDNGIVSVNRNIFTTLSKLKYLFLDDNKLTEIPIDSLYPLKRLTALYLANNVIKNVPKQLSTLKNLQYLYLSGNKIIHMHPKSLDGLESLKHIWLNKNKIGRLDQHLSTAFHQVQEINLLNNPWLCDCNIIWVVMWYKSKDILHSPVCYHPHINISWSDISLHEMRCSPEKDCLDPKRGCSVCPAYQRPNKHGKCQCMAGYQMMHNASICTECQVGYYSDGVSGCKKCPNNSACTTTACPYCTCVPGYTFTNQCSECPANTYKSKDGLYSCLTCPEYSTSQPGSNHPTSCKCMYQIKPDTIYEPELFKCLPPTTEMLESLVSTDEQTSNLLQTQEYQGPVTVGIATFCCTISIIVILALYIWRSGKYRHLRRNASKDVTSETLTLSSIDWLDGCSLSKDGQYVMSGVPIRKLKIGRTLGKGAFGVVKEASAHGGSGYDNKVFNVAVKMLRDTASDYELNSIKQELDQMKLIGKHTNIITLYGYCRCQGQVMIIMELAELGDLLTYLKEKSSNIQNYVTVSPDGHISEEEIKQITEDRELMLFAWQVAKGMSHIESLKCIHRDLAARNVLLSKGPIAKISDFGLSRDVYENGYYLRETKGRLPFKWLSPEALLWGQFSSKGDVWSYGMLLWEITTMGASPYPGIPAETMPELHRSGYRMSKPPNCPIELYEVMKSCWHEDPRKRPTFSKLCESMESFLLGAVDLNYLEIQQNPIYNNELAEYDYNSQTLRSLGSEEMVPCLQKFSDLKCDSSSGY